MTRLSHRATALVMVALLVATSTACRSMRELPAAQTAPSQPPTWPVKPGDTVRVTLADGQRVEFKVAAVEADALVATNGTRYQNAGVTRVKAPEARRWTGLRIDPFPVHMDGRACEVLREVAFSVAGRTMAFHEAVGLGGLAETLAAWNDRGARCQSLIATGVSPGRSGGGDTGRSK